MTVTNGEKTVDFPVFAESTAGMGAAVLDGVPQAAGADNQDIYTGNVEAERRSVVALVNPVPGDASSFLPPQTLPALSPRRN